jgi:hypothetical protein
MYYKRNSSGILTKDSTTLAGIFADDFILLAPNGKQMTVNPAVEYCIAALSSFLLKARNHQLPALRWLHS